MRKLIILAASVAALAVVVVPAYAASIAGTSGADTLRGTPKADVLTGKSGADTLYGFGGNDRFIPGPGKDRVLCGAGIDRVQADRLDVVAKDCEIVSRPPAPTARSSAGARRHELNPVPFGTTFRLGNGWSLKVDSITPDATAIVMAENMFNKAPAPGGQFFIATVTLTNVSSADTRFRNADLRSLGSLNIPYTTFTNSCGVIPNSFLFAGSEAFPGGSLTRNVCWQVSTGEAGNLQMFHEPLFGGSRVFFALR